MEKEIKSEKKTYFDLRKVSHSDYNNFHVPYWLVEELKDKNLRILDYGCGFGQLIFGLKSLNFNNVYGVDISRQSYDYCKSKGFDVRLLNGNELKNPYDFKFDIIILSHVIEHIQKDEIIKALFNIKENFLSEGGKLLISVPNAQSKTGCYWAYEDWTHTTLFTSGSLYYVLKSSGFGCIEFIDIDCTLGLSWFNSVLKKALLFFYKFNISFWNRVTSSSYHKQSSQIHSFEIKVKAWND